MTKFTVESTYNKKDFLRVNKIKWKIYWLKNLKQIRNFSITAVAFVILSTLSVTKEEPVNIYVILALAFGLLVIFLTSIRRFAKKNITKIFMKFQRNLNQKKWIVFMNFQKTV